MHQCYFESTSERERCTGQLHATLRKIKATAADADGFAKICDVIQLRWIKVGYLKKLAQRDGPFPRHQDLNVDGVHVGQPPGRKFSLSHGWASETHPCPSGAKLKRLAEKLDLLGADDEADGVFIDYCSLPQKSFDIPDAYFERTKAQKPMQDRSPLEQLQFSFAMWEMTRLYAAR